MIEYYQQQLNNTTAQITRYSQLVNRYSLSRLVVILAGLALLFFSFKFDNIWFSLTLALFIAILFGWLVKSQMAFEVQKDYFLTMKAVLENELSECEFRESIYSDGSQFIDDHHPYSSDLDVFGPRSLFQMINRCATNLGVNELANWLKAPAEIVAIEGRQEAVKELSEMHTWRLHFQTVLFFCLKLDNDIVSNLHSYLKQPIQRNKALRAYVKVAPFVFLGFLALAVFIPKMLALLFIVSLIHVGIIVSHQLYINKTDAQIGKIGKTLSKFSEAFKTIEDEKWQSSLCIHLADDFKTNSGKGVSGSIKELAGLIKKLDYRLNVYVAVVLNAVFLWDLKQVFAIEDWKKSNTANIDEAFHVLAKFEVLNSLASLSANNNKWIYPIVTKSENYLLEARDLGHPLIAESFRITNDYALINERKIDIITGSNMAGKSTFLRTIGINAVMALCGAPVCAAQMRLSPMHLITYMRIRDSLNESTSTFKAELNRLQMVLETVPQKTNAFFLVDEMLRGTNSVDKYRGSKAVVEKLIASNGVGIVATHDLQIAHLIQKYPSYIRNYYFDIEVRNGAMVFDYKLKDGECKTFNASLLLKQIGVEIEE
ncbi:DNA mismatch repair protein MutS [Solitalea sp. MAHUQ-68]|uniref:DNA mismatch repair protein MutS n=1 Tax=Solitalea agri TaxID=2953739 RepID=A0A9X2F2I4_9SPHI|nr:DNA mismatch repair protein MutS [Solitalea agri]MCO4292925.1 DNA mismatch repair protein MutS [Solitalea agri]